MNILMIHPHDLFSRKEPWTIRIKNIAQEFKRKGHSVKIIYFPLEYQKQSAFIIDGIEYIPLSRRLGINNYFKNIRCFCGQAKWAEIIHVQKCFYYAALPALLAGFISNKPVHYDWDDWEIKIFHYCAKQPRLVGGFLWALERYIPNLCDTVSVSSQRLKQECIKYKVAPDKIAMAPVGADLDLFHPNISSIRIREKYNLHGPIISYLGQLHGGQYAEQFIRAAKIISNQLKGITFFIIGGGYRLEELKTLAKDMDLAKQIIFTGAISHQETPLYLAATDICVACFEDNDITQCKSPLKIAEYLASGKPIVASDVGEVKRMLGGAGILTLPGDSEDLACGIIKLLNDEPLRQRLAKKARQRAEELYNWQTTTENLLKIYAQSWQ
jgi:glycosyltransferase involved in cell wall biosynthesis